MRKYSPAGGGSPQGLSGLSRGSQFFLVVFVAYVVAPVRDIPLLGLSLSLPTFVFLLNSLRGHGSKLFTYRPNFLPFGVLFWFGLLLSVMVNSGRATAGPAFSLMPMLKWVTGMGYWIVVMVVIGYLIGRLSGGRTVLLAIGIAITGLAFMVLVGRMIGQPYSLIGMTQNGVGIRFSTFGIAPLVMARTSSGARRWLWWMAFAVVGLAAIINASRSSWIALGFVMLIFTVFEAISRGRVGGVVILGLVIAMVIVAVQVAPPQLTAKFQKRSDSLQNLERDKAFQARLVLTRKAMHLFSRYPFFGIGPGNFYYMWVDLELPRALRGKRDKINRIGAHNAYGQLLAEGGLAMAVPFFLLVGGLFYRGFPAVVRLVRCGDTWAAGFFAMFVGMSMHFVTIAGLGDTSTFMVYGLVAGVIVFDYRRAVSGVGRREGMKNSGGFAGQTHGPPGLGSEVQRSRFLG